MRIFERYLLIIWTTADYVDQSGHGRGQYRCTGSWCGVTLFPWGLPLPWHHCTWRWWAILVMCTLILIMSALCRIFCHGIDSVQAYYSLCQVIALPQCSDASISEKSINGNVNADYGQIHSPGSQTTQSMFGICLPIICLKVLVLESLAVWWSKCKWSFYLNKPRWLRGCSLIT